MPAAVVELAGINAVERVSLGYFGRPDITVHGRKTPVSLHIIQPNLHGLDFGRRMAEIEKGPRGTQSGEKVPVVTTSTYRAASTSPRSRTMSIISSAVTTTALPLLILSLISR